MKETGKTSSSRAFTGKHESPDSATGRQASLTGKQASLTGRQPAQTGKTASAGRQTANTAKQTAYTGRQASYTARQLSATARQRIVEQKKKRNRKRTLYIVFTALAAATIIVAAFILKGAAEQRSYNTHYGNALQSYYSGDYDSALASLRRASAISETEECSLLMVDCYEKQGNYPKALELLEDLYKKDKNNTAVSARIASIKMKISEKKNESLVTVAGKQYEAWTSSLSVKDTALGDGILGDVVKLYSLTSLTLSGDSLTDISPLSALGGLVFLDLSNNSVSDIDPLGSLRELKTLYLDNNPITDFSVLYSLPQLEMLSIRGIAVTEEQLGALSEAMPNCTIHSNPGIAEETVSDVTVGTLSFRTDAEELDLSNMGITDLSPLTVCKKLKKLDITGNGISDLTPLMDLTELEWICFKDNVVTDLRPLMGMRTLRYINAEGNGITGTTPLSTLTELSELYLAFNPIEDLSGLRSLVNLRRLGLENTALTDEDLNLLAALSGLDVLRIYDNPDLSGEAVDELKARLRGCDVQHSELVYYVEMGGEKIREDSTEVILFDHGVSDISPILRFKKLEKLDLGANQIDNIYTFQYLTAPLRELHLGNNNISDGTPLMYLDELELLDISGNRLSSVSPIRQLSNLKWLKLTGNPLSEEQIAELREALPNCEIIFDN
ncbi:MAG: leucine-rich repeat domain-containing protein [Oscillospiraceae bacterium]|nr:leucine-rich repeat domain-containing protein [Oscillospiraceae bacterium]